MSKVPVEIVAAVNALLSPYGESYASSERAESRGYLNWKKAAEYTGLSKSTLQRAVRAGLLKAPHKIADTRNGTALFEVSELDRFIRSH